MASRVDGKTAAATVVNRKRAVLSNAMEYAVELKLLNTNPIPALKWKAPRVTHLVDRRSVANPVQARTLLNAVRTVKRSGPRLVACYACSYYSALRPEEAVNVRMSNIVLVPLQWNAKTEQWEPPAEDWGEFHLEGATPHAGKEWTDSGRHRDERGLKHRAKEEVRVVPIPPELSRIIRAHLAEFGAGPDGRLFRGERGEKIPVVTYSRVWHKARAVAFTPEVVAGPLVKVPYDLRHAAVSTWLNGGVPATQVAEWAGHSVEVLLKVYAKCLDGQDKQARDRMAASLQ
jgi:integrase